MIYVDDGSRDGTLTIAQGLAADALDVQVLALSRNFGKEAALLAGLDHARFGAVLFMDGDGQHPPQLVETLVAHWLDDGYDVVYTAKAHRENEPWARRLGVKLFYQLINWGARQRIPADAGDFRLLSPRAAAALRQLPERNRFFKGLASWIGFRQFRVDYEPAERAHGRTTWNLYSLVALSIEGLTSFSVAPLRLASLLGLILAATAMVFGVAILFETVFYGRSVPGYPSLVVGLDGDRRRATGDDRDRRRIYRKDPLRTEGAAGVFRRRAQREVRRAGRSARCGRMISAGVWRRGHCGGGASSALMGMSRPPSEEGRRAIGVPSGPSKGCVAWQAWLPLGGRLRAGESGCAPTITASRLRSTPPFATWWCADASMPPR